MSKKELPKEERKVKFTISICPKLYAELNKLSNKSKYIESVLEKAIKTDNYGR